MGGLIQLGIWAAVAASLWFGYITFTNNLRKEGAEAQRTADLQIIQKCELNLKTAQQANESLKADLGQLQTSVASINAEVDRIAAEGARVAKAKDTALAITSKNLVTLEDQRRAALERARVFQSSGESCEIRLKSLGDRMRSFAAGELRDRPPAGSGDGAGGNGNGQGAGTDQVRVK
jgi:peptidoglycan hydrolase CwlO-like protein